MPSRVTFPRTEPIWLFNRDCVRFYAVVDSEVLPCLVSGEALYSNFGASDFTEQEALRAFREHQVVIQQVAERKILEGEYRRGDEVLLRMNDFKRQGTPATTTVPPAFRHLQAHVAPEIDQDPLLSRGVSEANSILEEDLVREGMHVSAWWNIIPNQSAVKLARLQLTDGSTDAKVEGLFTGADLANLPTARFSLFRLWDDLLRERGRKQMQALELMN